CTDTARLREARPEPDPSGCPARIFHWRTAKPDTPLGLQPLPPEAQVAASAREVRDSVPEAHAASGAPLNREGDHGVVDEIAGVVQQRTDVHTPLQAGIDRVSPA